MRKIAQHAPGLLFDHTHDVALLHDEEILCVDLDLGAGPFAEQHLVALLEIDGDQLAGFVATARAYSDDLAFLRLLSRRIGDEDAAGRFGFRVCALDHYAIVERTKLHCCDAPIASGAAHCGRLKVMFWCGILRWHSLQASANACPLVGSSVRSVKKYHGSLRQRCRSDPRVGAVCRWPLRVTICRSPASSQRQMNPQQLPESLSPNVFRVGPIADTYPILTRFWFGSGPPGNCASLPPTSSDPRSIPAKPSLSMSAAISPFAAVSSPE